MLARVLLLLLALGAAIAAWALRSGAIEIPDRWNPSSTLNVETIPNVLTRLKLSRLSDDATLCQQVLATTSIEYARLSDRQTGPACGFQNAVRIDRTSSEVTESFSLSCRAAVSLALWERHVLQPAAQAHFGLPVTRIEHFGSYACRNVYGRSNATRSRHATAEAFDIAGFILADGARIRVISDWKAEGAASRFLHDVRDGACRFFDGVLSPDYNEAHRDHFHFDRGPYRVCR
ncbi:MAG: extensin family protein [Steroidobacter sp.]